MHIFFNKNSNHFSGGVFSDNLFGKNTVIIMRKIPLAAFPAARGMSFYVAFSPVYVLRRF